MEHARIVAAKTAGGLAAGDRLDEQDWQLCRDCVAGDGEACRRLFKRHEPRIAHQMWRFSRDRVTHGELVQEVLELYAPIAEAKGIGTHLAIELVPPVQGDRDLLFEAVANLVDNAIKFTPENGDVELALLDTAAGPVLQVDDTGPGIAAEHRSHVFARFRRLDKSRHVPGSGLGLSLVQAIVHMHGFSISLSEGPSGGCSARLSCGSGQAVAMNAALPVSGPDLLMLQPRTG